MPEMPETFAPVNDLAVGDALEAWRWLAGTSAEPKLLTAMGDLIVVRPVGLFRRQAVFLLDACAGTLEQIAPSWGEFKALLSQGGNEVSGWFKVDLLVALREQGLLLEQGECYSPIHPPALGGSYELEDFETTAWRVHLGIMGQIHEQVRDLPEGTPITGVTIKEAE